MNGVSAFMIPLPTGGERKRNEKREHPVQPLAQAMELTARYQRAKIAYAVLPGMLCVEKSGMAMFPDKPVLMLWRMLDATDWLDQVIIKDCIDRLSISRLDCIVARLSDDADHITFCPHDTELLEPYHEASAAPKRSKRMPPVR
jgi:hypothetical protein